ncbi:hemolysin D [Oceanisphaera avium]|uniref:Hemolysin D n=2 Tax=Oceanisphaera avium TaxID=1903694 RepID=A0A1Y0D0K9_9GAMM|nr:hemolysin D [Oceanisphaera avium]
MDTDLMNTLDQDTAIPPKRRRLRLVLLILIPSLLALIGLIFYLLGGRYVETDNAYVKADKVPISTQVSGAVAQVLVRENESVNAGQLLFTLDPAQFEVEQAQAQAKLAQVVTNLTALKASYGEKEAELELANSQLVYAKKQEARQTNLSAKNFTSAASLDDARQTTKMAALKIAAIQQEMASIRANLAGGPERPLEEHPLYKSALADLNLAKLNLARTAVRAAVPGVVSKLPKVSQYLNTGTIALMLIETGSPWVEANFTENDITHMHAGLPVSITIDAYPSYKWTGTVNSLSPGTGAEFSVIPAQNATGNWVKITQRVPVRIQLNPDADAPPLRAGLSATVEVDTEQKNRLAALWPF